MENRLLMKVISLVVVVTLIITAFRFQFTNLKKVEAKSSASKSQQFTLSSFSNKSNVDRYLKEINSGQFKAESVKESKQLVANVINELKQIVMQRSKEDLAQYDEYVLLENKIEESKAVYLLLKLKDNFGELEVVLDEYLLSIQLNIDLENRLTSEEGYKKEKDENINKIRNGEIITLAKIQQVYLEKVQQRSNDILNKDRNRDENIINNKFSDDMDNKQLRDGELNNINDTKVQYPTVDAMKEIEDINNRSINAEGR